MCLTEAVGDETFWVIAHAARTGFVQAVTRNLRRLARAFKHASRGTQYFGTRLLRVLPHLQSVFVPLKVQPRYRNAVWILDLRVEVHIIRVRAQRWRLHREVDWSGIAALDLALERRTKTVEAAGIRNAVRPLPRLGIQHDPR